MAVGPGYFRPDGKRSTKDGTHRHIDESDEASRVSSFLSLRLTNNGVRWHTLVPKVQMPAEIREKDRIQRLRLCQYLTRTGKVAILGTDFGNPAVQMATLEGEVATLSITLATLAPSFGNPERRLAIPRFR